MLLGHESQRDKGFTHPDFFRLFFFKASFSTSSSSESDEKTFLQRIYIYTLSNPCIYASTDTPRRHSIIQSTGTYFSLAARWLTISSGSIPLLFWDSSCVSFSFSSFLLSFFGTGRGVNFSDHFLRRSFTSRTTLKEIYLSIFGTRYLDACKFNYDTEKLNAKTHLIRLDNLKQHTCQYLCSDPL